MQETYLPRHLRIGDFEITGFGGLLAVAAVVSLQIFSRELVRAGLPARVTDVGFAGVFGGLRRTSRRCWRQ